MIRAFLDALRRAVFGLPPPRHYQCVACGLSVHTHSLPSGWIDIDGTHVCHETCPETCPTCGASMALEMYPGLELIEDEDGREYEWGALCQTCYRSFDLSAAQGIRRQ